jgi:galactokinase
MTGAGFGGACVALVERAQLEGFLADAERLYRTRAAYEPRFYACDAVDGAALCGG